MASIMYIWHNVDLWVTMAHDGTVWAFNVTIIVAKVIVIHDIIQINIGICLKPKLL